MFHLTGKTEMERSYSCWCLSVKDFGSLGPFSHVHVNEYLSRDIALFVRNLHPLLARTILKKLVPNMINKIHWKCNSRLYHNEYEANSSIIGKIGLVLQIIAHRKLFAISK